MEKTVRDHIVRALDDLEKDNLKRFRNKLNDCTVKEGYERISKGRLQDADTEDLTKLILQYYGVTYGVELTVAVLKAINENEVAVRLGEILAKDSSASASCSNPEKHFVDKHQVELVNRVCLVAPILDRLLSEELLNYEEYDTIMEAGTSYAQMRELYKTKVRSWKNPQKDKLKTILRDTNRVLVEDLEKS